MSEAERIRVLVVDDHVMVAEGITFALRVQRDLDVLGFATTMKDACAKARALRPDVVLMDYRLPDGDGAQATRAIMRDVPAARVVIMTSYTSDPVVLSVLDAGCVGVVAKERCMDEGVTAIRAAARGETYLPSSMISRVLPRSNGADAPQALTSREREILTLLARGYSTQRMANDLFLSVKTIRNHIQNVNMKLRVHSKLEAVTKAIRDGLIQAPDRLTGT